MTSIAESIQFAVRRIPKEMFGGRGRHTRKLVLAMLASHADPDGSSCFPGIHTLSHDCALTERAIQKVISWLRQNGFLKIAYKAGPKQANVYKILIPKAVVNSGRDEQRTSCPEEHGVVNWTPRGGEQVFTQPTSTNQRPSNGSSSAAKIREEKKTPPRRKNSSPKGKPSAVDPRFVEFKNLFWEYYRQHVHVDPDWDGREGAALKRFLKANPDLTSEQWRRILDNRTLSPIPHAERLSAWIGRAKSWLNGRANKWGDAVTGDQGPRRTAAQRTAAQKVSDIDHAASFGFAPGQNVGRIPR